MPELSNRNQTLEILISYSEHTETEFKENKQKNCDLIIDLTSRGSFVVNFLSTAWITDGDVLRSMISAVVGWCCKLSQLNNSVLKFLTVQATKIIIIRKGNYS